MTISIDVCCQTIGAKRFADTRYSEVYEVCPVGLECVGREFHGAGGLFIGVSGSSRHSASFAMEMVAVWMGLPKCHATLHRRPLRICQEWIFVLMLVQDAGKALAILCQNVDFPQHPSEASDEKNAGNAQLRHRGP